ncbi:unnamed protein product [Phytophthora fragariaefolia]|uniref:Unnamed protein product n=1 Tax=Phytophthora fragariaefolia TaxID=1490495 RepID=A0A9W7DC70_9STRA|nr:unnamed protein product [Phytophthora fragariaefolia]
MPGAYWFSTMELMSAYNQVHMREEDIKYTAFQASNGLWELHEVSAQDVLRDNKLYAKHVKCVFSANEIPFLSDFIGRNGVGMDPYKVQTIKDWRVPQIQEGVHSFLGLNSYVPRFGPEYTSLAVTMFTLLKMQHKRNAKIHLSDEQLINFKELKRRLGNPPVVHLPDFSQHWLSVIKDDSTSYSPASMPGSQLSFGNN